MIELGDGNIEWDLLKNIENTHKHGILFEEATTIFFYNESVMIEDEAHSQN